jgi:S-adenosylmethionine:tRNA ribosyltransferase-isomerase
MIQISEFDYELPSELIAQTPTRRRSDSRLLILPPKEQPLISARFGNLVDRLGPGDLLVVNDTRVLAARLFAEKAQTGGRVEVLIERLADKETAVVQLRVSKTPPAGTLLRTTGGVELKVVGRQGPFFVIKRVDGASLAALLHDEGTVPLPPYVTREAEDDDVERYQTVYARVPGAVAAPTAGLHFDNALLRALDDKGVDIAYLTLHIGAGTFQPVQVETLAEHRMHSEHFVIGKELVDAVNQARKRAGRVVAVGTTVVRALESAIQQGALRACSGETSLFIKPGFSFQVVDMIITNFHLPRSTLLVLVSAFSGCGRIRTAYKQAISERYRFFSYGDAMLLEEKVSK